MYVVKLTKEEAAMVAFALDHATYEVLVAYDPMDKAFKVKTDNRAWSPPLGKEIK